MAVSGGGSRWEPWESAVVWEGWTSWEGSECGIPEPPQVWLGLSPGAQPRRPLER